jgi:CelD/BcsL family acetyltransferase involved in cellulose biosynthesis
MHMPMAGQMTKNEHDALSRAASRVALDDVHAAFSRDKSHQRLYESIEVYTTFDEAREIWNDLCGLPCLSTPFQEFMFLENWQRSIGTYDQYKPLIVVIYDAAKNPLAILPFVTTSAFGLKVAEFAGGKHATFNMGMWRRAFAANITRKDLDHIFSDIRTLCKDIDLIVLQQQPRSWNGFENPFSLLPRQTSVNNCPRLTIADPSKPQLIVSNSFRRRLRSKEKKLESQGGYRHTIVKNSEELTRIMDAFFRIKPQRMALQKLPDTFSESKVRDFVMATCALGLDKSKLPIDIHALETDDEVLAIFTGVADGARFSMMYNTYTMSANARHSPGLILIRRIIDHYAQHNYRTIDLGVGDAEYKTLFCKDTEPLFDSFLGLSAIGKLAAPLFALRNRIKRQIKKYPALVGMLRGMECVFCKKFAAKSE